MEESPDPGTTAALLHPSLPVWARRKNRPTGLEEAAFTAGAAISSLHAFASIADDAFPKTLWRQRLALVAAAEVVSLQGRGEDKHALRDAFYLTRAGDDPGPAGRVLADWRQLGHPKAMRPTVWCDFFDSRISARSDDTVRAALQKISDETERRGSVVATAARAAAMILDADPSHAALSLWIADAVLAGQLGWSAPVPLLALSVGRKELRNAPSHLQGDPSWLQACYHGYARAVARAFDLAVDLNRRAVQLKTIAPKLRAKGADRAVQIFLSEDAVQPSGSFTSLTGMSDRAARRLCERLETLCVVRELTGRSTSRLYGL